MTALDSPPPARRTQAERRAESSRRLLAAAVELIGEQGWDRTTAAEIGERAGYSRAMVRDRYGSKEELLVALQREFEQRLIADPDPSQNGLEQLLEGIARVRRMLDGEAAYLRALLTIAFEAAGPLEVMRPVMQQWVATLEAAVAAWLQAGQVDGSVRAEVVPAAEAEATTMQAIGGAYRWVLAGDDFDFDAFIGRLMDALRGRWSA